MLGLGLGVLLTGGVVIAWDLADAYREAQTKMEELRRSSALSPEGGGVYFQTYGDVGSSMLGVGLGLCVFGLALSGGALYKFRNAARS